MKPNAVASPQSQGARNPRHGPHGGLSFALRQSLTLLQQGASEPRELRINLPPEDSLRMRNLVHRGTQRPVFKLASLKLDRVVQCESLLEYEAALLLDVCPEVAEFAEQPVRIDYVADEKWRYHIPDFVVLEGGVATFLEIKFQKDVDDDVLARTRQMQDSLFRLGARYQLLTELQIRRGGFVQSAIRVSRRARHAVTEAQLMLALEKLREYKCLPLAAFGWSVSESLEAVCIAQLIARGKASVDAATPISEYSFVRLVNESNEKEDASWWPVASA